MKELKEKLEKVMDDKMGGGLNHVHELEDMAKKWAVFSLDTFSGLLRDKSLRISTAIMDFMNELNILEKENDGRSRTRNNAQK